MKPNLKTIMKNLMNEEDEALGSLLYSDIFGLIDIARKRHQEKVDRKILQDAKKVVALASIS